MSFLFLFVSLARAAEPAWTTREVPLHRWDDGEITVATLEPSSRVEVLVTDGDKTRVRRGIDFGWIPSDALTRDEPADAAPEPSAPSFTFGPGMTITPKPGGAPPAR